MKLKPEKPQRRVTGEEASEFLDLLRMHLLWEVGKSLNSSLYADIYHDFFLPSRKTCQPIQTAIVIVIHTILHWE